MSLLLAEFNQEDSVGGLGSPEAARHLHNKDVLLCSSFPITFFYSFDIANAMSWKRLEPSLDSTDLIIFNRPWPHAKYDRYSVRDMHVRTIQTLYTYLRHRAIAVTTLRRGDRQVVLDELDKLNWAPSNRTTREFTQLYASQRCIDQLDESGQIFPTNIPSDLTYAIITSRSKDAIYRVSENFCLMEQARETLLAGRNVLSVGCHTLEFEVALLEYFHFSRGPPKLKPALEVPPDFALWKSRMAISGWHLVGSAETNQFINWSLPEFGREAPVPHWDHFDFWHSIVTRTVRF